ncbi:DUF2933 domain-containing protein [Paenibacillus caui]|uniref:DUF2933 domain-containing protein n=1 Tax=Paenibacillus caui TaxID=2873927 RepID=UPI001CA94713|nr:DUF2933 domain-containing protein [Paenibacillus caui]
MDWSWLLFLACPLMMVFMMFGMGGMHKSGSHTHHKSTDAAIQGELRELKAQNEQMRQELGNLSQKENSPGVSTGRESSDIRNEY